MNIRLFKNPRQIFLNHSVSNLHRMPRALALRTPEPGEIPRQVESAPAVPYRKAARPDPLHAQGGLSPPFGDVASAVGDREFDAAQVTSVVVSGPNFNGVRVRIGGDKARSQSA